MAAASRKQVAPIGADPAPPGTLVVLGAGGDLAKRLLLPALYNLVLAHQLSDRFAVLGVDHKDRSAGAAAGILCPRGDGRVGVGQDNHRGIAGRTAELRVCRRG